MLLQTACVCLSVAIKSDFFSINRNLKCFILVITLEVMNRKVYISTTHEYVKFATSIFALARYLSKTGSSLSACCSNRRTLHYKYYHNPSPV